MLIEYQIANDQGVCWAKYCSSPYDIDEDIIPYIDSLSENDRHRLIIYETLILGPPIFNTDTSLVTFEGRIVDWVDMNYPWCPMIWSERSTEYLPDLRDFEAIVKLQSLH